MVGFEDAPDPGVEVVVVEIDGDALVVLEYDQEVAVDQVEAFDY